MDAGLTPIVLTVNVTGTEMLPDPAKMESDELIVPGARPAGSAVTVTDCGVVPLSADFPLTFSQVALAKIEYVSGAPVVLSVSVVETAVPPESAEKVRVGAGVLGLSMLMVVCADRLAAAAARKTQYRVSDESSFVTDRPPLAGSPDGGSTTT